MKNSILILLACFSLSACQSQAETPKQVAEKYWLALQNGDSETARKLVSQNTRGNLDNYLALPADEKKPLNKVELDIEFASVGTTIISNGDENSQDSAFDTILILENGQWKIDAARTQVPAAEKTESTVTKEQLSEALKQNLESMDKALEQGGEMLDDFMQEGSKEMSDTLLKGMNKMNQALREAVEKMKQRREQEDRPAPPANENNNNGEGLI